MNIEINIENLPEMPFEADWEYHYGWVVAIWRNSLASGVVYYFNYFDQEWQESVSGRGCVIYARPKPKPEEHSCGGPREACMTPGCQECGMEPKPKPEPEPYIDRPIEWGVYPMVQIEDPDRFSEGEVADIGLVHRHNGREYRLARFLYPNGTLSQFSVRDDICERTIKATHARFYLVAE